MTHPRSLPAIDRLHADVDGPSDLYRELYRGIEYVVATAVDGHVAEFGTSTGRTAMVLAKGIADYTHKYVVSEEAHRIGTRKLMLFDSFEGFPNALHPIDQAAPHIACGIWGAGVMKDANAAILREMCEVHLPTDRVEIVEGWYSETLVKLAPGTKFSMIHIDCDFYASTLAVLERLFEIDAFSDGCAIFFDDWYCNRGSPKFGEQRAWADIVAKYRPQFTDWGAYATVGRRFIIHR